LNMVECGQVCTIEVAIPVDVVPGAYHLILTTGGARLSFDLQVTDPSGS
jgi:hypothetical protein